MSHRRIVTLAGVLCACLAPQSTFYCYLDGADYAPHARVAGESSTGHADNAGNLALGNGSWSLTMGLGGLAVGAHPNVSVTLVDKGKGEIFTTAVGGRCTAILDPHGSTNGDALNCSAFYCTGLASSDGKQVDVSGGAFSTFISDVANDPNAIGP